MTRRFTDQEKRRKGTFDKRWSSATKARQVVSAILDFPVLDEIPEPPHYLNETGQETYSKWCSIFLDSGLLTAYSVDKIAALAFAEQEIAERLCRGKPISVRVFDDRHRIVAWISALDVAEDTIADLRLAKTYKATHQVFQSRSAQVS